MAALSGTADISFEDGLQYDWDAVRGPALSHTTDAHINKLRATAERVYTHTQITMRERARIGRDEEVTMRAGAETAAGCSYASGIVSEEETILKRA